MNRPDFSYELSFAKKYSRVLGVDEVGRGAFAGPVVAGVCALKTQFPNKTAILNKILGLGINDSKLLKAQQRIRLISFIKTYFDFAIGETNADYINRFGIVKATQMAARQAIGKLLRQIQPKADRRLAEKDCNCFLLCDGFPIPYIRNISKKRQLAIIRGDQKSVTIAAASIVAKVYRDKLMKRLSQDFSIYGWEKNKGYGTYFHRSKIKLNGITIWHRTKFVETWLYHSHL